MSEVRKSRLSQLQQRETLPFLYLLALFMTGWCPLHWEGSSASRSTQLRAHFFWKYPHTHTPK